MKKGMIVFLAAAMAAILCCCFIYVRFSGELKKIKQVAGALGAEVVAFKEEQVRAMHALEDKLGELVTAYNSQVMDGEEKQVKIEALKRDYSGLQKRMVGLRSEFADRCDALYAQQRQAGERIEKEAEPAKVPVSKPEDVRLSFYFNAGKQAFDDGDYAKAKELFGRLLEVNPVMWEAHLYYIQAAYYANPAQAASDKTVNRLLDALPADYAAVAVKYKGLLNLERGAYNEAVAALEQYRGYKKEAAGLLALGECYLVLKKEAQAGVIFREVVELFPGSREAQRAETYMAKGGL